MSDIRKAATPRAMQAVIDEQHRQICSLHDEIRELRRSLEPMSDSELRRVLQERLNIATSEKLDDLAKVCGVSRFRS